MKNKDLREKKISTSTISIFGKKTWFLEYSVHQKSFHFDTLENILRKNRGTCSKQVCLGYVIIDGPMVYDDLYPSMKKWYIILGLETTGLDGNVYKPTLNGGFKIVEKAERKQR